jgi:cysteine desulfurase
MANNEIGTIQNMKEISDICQAASTYLHVDAVQVATHIPLSLSELNADLVSFSGHKFHAPKGIGMLYIKNGTHIENLLHGGQQEHNLRSGTENVPYIVGFTKALELGMKSMFQNILRQNEYISYIVEELKKSNIDFRINGPNIGENRLPGNLNISIKDLEGSDITYYLNKANIFVSTGSACDSSSIEPSHVLQAIAVPLDYINASLRITVGDNTTFEEVQYATKTLIEIIND